MSRIRCLNNEDFCYCKLIYIINDDYIGKDSSYCRKIKVRYDNSSQMDNYHLSNHTMEFPISNLTDDIDDIYISLPKLSIYSTRTEKVTTIFQDNQIEYQQIFNNQSNSRRSICNSNSLINNGNYNFNLQSFSTNNSSIQTFSTNNYNFVNQTEREVLSTIFLSLDSVEPENIQSLNKIISIIDVVRGRTVSVVKQNLERLGLNKSPNFITHIYRNNIDKKPELLRIDTYNFDLNNEENIPVYNQDGSLSDINTLRKSVIVSCMIKLIRIDICDDVAIPIWTPVFFIKHLKNISYVEQAIRAANNGSLPFTSSFIASNNVPISRIPLPPPPPKLSERQLREKQERLERAEEMRRKAKAKENAMGSGIKLGITDASQIEEIRRKFRSTSNLKERPKQDYEKKKECEVQLLDHITKLRRAQSTKVIDNIIVCNQSEPMNQTETINQNEPINQTKQEIINQIEQIEIYQEQEMQ